MLILFLHCTTYIQVLECLQRSNPSALNDDVEEDSEELSVLLTQPNFVVSLVLTVSKHLIIFLFYFISIHHRHLKIHNQKLNLRTL